MPPGKPPRDDQDFYPYMELRRARLCLDCEMIFDAPQCPACASGSFIPITRWIRPSQTEPAPRASAGESGETSGAPAPKAPRRLLRKSVYVGLGAYGLWKMLFEPPMPRRRRASEQQSPKPGEPPEIGS